MWGNLQILRLLLSSATVGGGLAVNRLLSRGLRTEPVLEVLQVQGVRGQEVGDRVRRKGPGDEARGRG